MNALVIGYGNELRGDDGVGTYLARTVAERGWPGVRALAVHQLMPELAETIADAEVVVFVDAHADSDEAVAVRRVDPGAEPRPMGHHCSPGALLRLCQQLYGRSPTAWVVTVSGGAFEHGSGLSAAVTASCPIALERIQALLQGASSHHMGCMAPWQ
jgi:hydrogenase maturation protease